MKIAVASHKQDIVGEHAGRCRRFWVYEVEDGRVLGRTELQLAPEQTFHELHGAGPHPLDGVRAFIAASMGPGLVRKLTERGIEAVMTSEPDADMAVAGWLGGVLPRVRPEDMEHGQFGGHGHGHDHDHDHGHSGGGCH
jgi:predicted Fe-Mo cluster-binding NifX family protein